jgi:hypothetical protein
VRARIGAASKKAWANPEYRTRVGASIKRALADPKLLARRNAAIKRAKADPESRARASAAMKKAWADPEYRARVTASIKRASRDPRVRARYLAGRIKAAQRLLASRGGRPPMKTGIWPQGAKLRENGVSWPAIARQLTPTAFREDSRKAAESIRLGVKRWKNSHVTG